MFSDCKDLYKDITNANIHEVPTLVATAENFKDYGEFVQDFDNEKVWITPWPVQGKHKLQPGTGIMGGESFGRNKNCWEGDLIVNRNMAVDYGDFCHGRVLGDKTNKGDMKILTREANFHPDGGQVFYPSDDKSYILFLALPKDEVQPEDFKAFLFDGTHGVQIRAGVWHQPPFTRGDAEFKGKQGAVFACVLIDFVEEFNTFMQITLPPSREN